MTRISIVTGATRNLGFSLAQGLARRLDEDDVVYLTGRDSGRVAQSVRLLSGRRANVRGEVLDVSDREAVERFAGAIADRHGGVDRRDRRPPWRRRYRVLEPLRAGAT